MAVISENKKVDIRQKRKHLTNILDIVEHVEAEHDEHDKVGEEVSPDSSGKHDLVDLCLDLGYHPSFGINYSSGEVVTATEV